MTIRCLSILSLVLLLGACEPSGQSSATGIAPVAESVQVTGGAIRGSVGADGLKQYHGIPYAAPPVGRLRWAPPAPIAPWQGERSAAQAGPACMQPVGQGGTFYGEQGFPMSEDCLTLNVWTRADHEDEQLPVMVWVHGGALVTGRGDAYPGELLTSKGVVLVTINYRLGRFGFFAHPELSAENAQGASGNQGIRDQIQALQWVRDNIRRFGGDPDNVTIFGESAGSLSMSLLQASPLAKGLFHRVIGQSGGAFQPMWFRDRATQYADSAEALGQRFATALAGGSDEVAMADLRELSADHVLEVINSAPEFSNYDSLAIVDGEVIPDEVAQIFATGRQADVPVMIGSNANEGTTFLEFFTPIFGEGSQGFAAYSEATLPEVAQGIGDHYADDPREAWADLFGDVLFAYPMRAWARSMANVDSDAYLYWFTWSPPVANKEWYRAFHAGEIGYVFGNLTMFNATPGPEDHQLSEMMAEIWTQFARTGDPNGPGLPSWAPYSADTEAYMELGLETGQKSELRIARMEMIEKAWAQRRSRGTFESIAAD